MSKGQLKTYTVPAQLDIFPYFCNRMYFLNRNIILIWEKRQPSQYQRASPQPSGPNHLLMVCSDGCQICLFWGRALPKKNIKADRLKDIQTHVLNKPVKETLQMAASPGGSTG